MREGHFVFKAKASASSLGKEGVLDFNREEWAHCAGPEGSGESGNKGFFSTSTQMSPSRVSGLTLNLLRTCQG